MSSSEWPSIDYGCKLVESAMKGARTGQGEFVKEKALAPYLANSVQQSLAPALVGACVGAATGYLGTARKSGSRALACGFLGGVIGFVAAVLWESRELTLSVASGAWKDISRTRDEHWFEKHPIDYA